MIKLLIVDDEQIEREGLHAILRKGFPDLVIEEAKNGRIAVEMAATFRPDLILMDIKMPGMSGLEAVERIGEDYPAVKFVMVTAYDTFEYARMAIKLGVKDYVLKPSKSSEIVAIVGKVLNQIEEERLAAEESRKRQDALSKALPLVETDVVTQLLFDHVHEVHLDELVGLLGSNAWSRTTADPFALIVLLPPGEEHRYAEVKDKVRQTASGWVGALYGRQIPIVAFRNSSRSFRSQAVSLAVDLLNLAGSGKGWFVGIGNPAGSLDSVRQSYQEALIATTDPNVPVKHRFYADMPVLGGGAAKDGQAAKQREKQFFDQIRLGQWERVREDVMEYIRLYENEGVDLLQAQQRALQLLWIAARILGEMGAETEAPLYSFQPRDYRQLRSETGLLIDRLRQAHAEHHERLEPDAIHRIKTYIVEHSREDITLEAIGKQIGLSPFYISKAFKDQLGVNYIDFLTECRIENAKKLMADPGKSLKEITYEVGYRDPNYFSKVFKKTCDLSPTEYRRMLLGKKAEG